MWARVNAQSVAQENAVNLMQIDMLQLNVLQTQLDNVSMQATLIIGFALGMWAGETLDPLLERIGRLEQKVKVESSNSTALSSEQALIWSPIKTRALALETNPPADAGDRDGDGDADGALRHRELGPSLSLLSVDDALAASFDDVR